MKRHIIAAGTLAAFVAASAEAIIIRHDLEDAQYLQLGEQYSPSTAYVGNCAGILIDPQWVLTAAHCLHGAEQRLYYVRHGDQRFRAERVFLHPEFDPDNDEIFDAALVQLKDPVSSGQPAALYRERDELGMSVIFVGRGVSGNGAEGMLRQDGKQRGATNTVDAVTEHVVGFTFNAPPEATPMEGISSRADSGGPAFVEIDGERYVIGISSYQVSNGFTEAHYGVGEYYTRVSSIAPWLDQLMQNTPAPSVARHPMIDAIKAADAEAFDSAMDDAVLADAAVLREAIYQTVMLAQPELAARLIDAGVDPASIELQGTDLVEFVLRYGSKDYYAMLQHRLPEGERFFAADSAVLPLFVNRYLDDEALLPGVRRLLGQGANVNAQARSGDTALVIAGWQSNDQDVLKLLLENGADVNLGNNNGDNAVMDAAYLGKAENLALFLRHGADLAHTNKRGETALDKAVAEGHEQEARMLRAAMGLAQ